MLERRNAKITIVGGYFSDIYNLLNTLTGAKLSSSSLSCHNEGVSIQFAPDDINYRIIISEAIADWHRNEDWLFDADVIVMVLNACTMFTCRDAWLIEELFEGKNCDNVFFVINKYNQVEPEMREMVHTMLKKRLSGVFTDCMGRFNESLYHERVFTVDAQTSMKARENYVTAFLESHGYIPERERMAELVEDTNTGIPAFEDALNRYLKSRTRHFDRFGGR